jgi:hypothetical protein
MKRYFKNLTEHPGVPVASAMTFMCTLAGATNQSMQIPQGALFGLCASVAVWVPVLITNYTNNKQKIK